MRERKDSSVMRVAAVVTTAVTMLPRVAEANAGTPLIWGVMTHLLLGNFLIGIAEGILAWRFLPSRKPGVCIGLMVAANYFSTWLAHLSVNCWMGLFEWADVRYVGASFWCAVVVAWLFTIVAEFPFVWFVFRGEKGRFTAGRPGQPWSKYPRDTIVHLTVTATTSSARMFSACGSRTTLSLPCESSASKTLFRCS